MFYMRHARIHETMMDVLEIMQEISYVSYVTYETDCGMKTLA